MNPKHQRLNEEDESHTAQPPVPAPELGVAHAGAQERQVPQVTSYQPVQAVQIPGDQPARHPDPYPIVPNSPHQAIPQRAMPYHVQQSYPAPMRPQGIPVHQMMGVPSRVYWMWDIHFRKGCFCMQLRHTLATFFILMTTFHLEETVSCFKSGQYFFGAIMIIMLFIDIVCIWSCFRQRVETAKLIVWLLAVNFFFAILDLVLNVHGIALFAMLINFYMLALAFSEVNRLLNLQAGLNPYPQAQIMINQPQQFQQVPQNPPH